MRLNCDIVIQNWSCSSQGVGNQRKATRASLSIGRKPCSTLNKIQNGGHETAFLLLCTASNMSGTKYKISGNIAYVFAKFLQNGKATIRFKDPPHDLCLSKADPKSLRKLLSTLKLSTEDLKKLKLSVLTPAKKSEVKPPTLQMMIYKRSDYPTSTSFPVSLNRLGIINCGMVRIDMRILKLQNLVSLNLSNNRIKELDVSLDRLKLLKALNVSSNMLTKLPSKLCRSGLASMLTSLDLSDNCLSCLPISFGTMVSLIHVKLNDNNLCTVPSSIGELHNLRCLSVSQNQLRTLPSSIAHLHLDTLDISRNPFLDKDVWFDIGKIQVNMPSLQECAARVVKNSRTYYNHHSLGQYLCDFLDSAKICANCNGSCFESIIYHLARTVLSAVADNVVSTRSHDSVPVEVYFCSRICYTTWTTCKSNTE